MNVTSEKLMIAGVLTGLIVFGIALLTSASVLAIYLIGIGAIGVVMFGAALLVANENREPEPRRPAEHALARHH